MWNWPARTAIRRPRWRLAFVNAQPFVASNIIGATSLQQLEEDITSIDLTLSDEVMEEIEQLHSHRSNPCP